MIKETATRTPNEHEPGDFSDDCEDNDDNDDEFYNYNEKTYPLSTFSI